MLRDMSREVNTEVFLTQFLGKLTSTALSQSIGVATSESNAEDDEAAPPSPPDLLTLLLDIINSIKLEEKTVAKIIK